MSVGWVGGWGVRGDCGVCGGAGPWVSVQPLSPGGGPGGFGREPPRAASLRFATGWVLLLAGL